MILDARNQLKVWQEALEKDIDAGYQLLGHTPTAQEISLDQLLSTLKKAGYLPNATPHYLNCVSKQYELIFALLLVKIGQQEYAARKYWDGFKKHIKKLDPNFSITEIGNKFLEIIGKFRLRSTEEKALKYVAPILLHGGIPSERLANFFAFLQNEIQSGIYHPGAALTQIWCADHPLFERLDKPIQRFLKVEIVASDFVERCAWLLETKNPDDWDFTGLPDAVIEQYKKWLLDKSQQKTGTGRLVSKRSETTLYLELDQYGLREQQGETWQPFSPTCPLIFEPLNENWGRQWKANELPAHEWWFLLPANIQLPLEHPNQRCLTLENIPKLPEWRCEVWQLAANTQLMLGNRKLTVTDPQSVRFELKTAGQFWVSTNGQPVYAERPVLHIPKKTKTYSADWRVRLVKRFGSMGDPIYNKRLNEFENPDDILTELLPENVLGEYELSLWGPSGRHRWCFAVLAGLRIQQTTPFCSTRVAFKVDLPKSVSCSSPHEREFPMQREPIQFEFKANGMKWTIEVHPDGLMWRKNGQTWQTEPLHYTVNELLKTPPCIEISLPRQAVRLQWQPRTANNRWLAQPQPLDSKNQIDIRSILPEWREKGATEIILGINEQQFTIGTLEAQPLPPISPVVSISPRPNNTLPVPAKPHSLPKQRTKTALLPVTTLKIETAPAVTLKQLAQMDSISVLEHIRHDKIPQATLAHCPPDFYLNLLRKIEDSSANWLDAYCDVLLQHVPTLIFVGRQYPTAYGWVAITAIQTLSKVTLSTHIQERQVEVSLHTEIGHWKGWLQPNWGIRFKQSLILCGCQQLMTPTYYQQGHDCPNKSKRSLPATFDPIS